MNILLLRCSAGLALGLASASMIAVPASAQTANPRATTGQSVPAVEPAAQAKPALDAVNSVKQEPLPPPATETAETTPAEAYDEAFDAPPLQVGDATMNLLAWQSSGAIASQTRRSIPGEIAKRNYERYLKSFEYPIPQYMGSSLSGSSSSAVAQPK